MELDDLSKSKIRWHLGFNAGSMIPAGDRARLEEAMSLIPDEYWYGEIINHIRLEAFRAHASLKSAFSSWTPSGPRRTLDLHSLAGRLAGPSSH